MAIPTEVEALDHYCIRVKFSDGVEGIVDLSHLANQGVFAIWNDYDVFRQVHIGSGGEIAWNDQIDLCPDTVYLKITGKKPQDIYPKLSEIPLHA